MPNRGIKEETRLTNHRVDSPQTVGKTAVMNAKILDAFSSEMKTRKA